VKLLFVLPEYTHQSGGGIIAFYRSVLPLLVAEGHEVRVIAGSGVSTTTDEDRFTDEGVAVETLSLERLNAWTSKFHKFAIFPALQRYLAAAWAIWEQAEAGAGFDLVEATDWGLLYLPWLCDPERPLIVSMHGSIGQIDMHDPLLGEEAMGVFIRLLEAESLREAFVIQANSPGNAEYWAKRLGRAVEMIYPAWPCPPEASDPTLRTGGGIVVGRVQRWKGPDVLCEALRHLGDDAPPIDWVGRDVAYGRASQSTSSAMAARHPQIWGKKVVPVGSKSAAETRSMQQRARFAVVPSTWDVFNMSSVEAMAYATPVVCSDAAGSSALIEDGRNGLLFEAGNARSLADAIARLLGLPEYELRELAYAGRETVAEKLAPASIVRQRLSNYEAATREFSKGSRRAAPSWAADIRAAQDAADHKKLAFLNQHSLRGIISHVGERIIEKARS
jgi:glycosyltransferase involved in cell wall biosynthesis